MFPVAIFPAIHWYLSGWPWSTSKCGDTADTPDSCQAGNVNSWAVDHWHRCRMIGWHITKSRLLKSSTPSKQNGELINGDENMPKKILPNSLHVWSKPTWRWTNKQHQAAHHQKNIWGPGPGQCLPKVAIIRTIWDSPIGTFGNCPENRS